MHIMIIGEVCGYRIKEPWTIKRFIQLLKTLGILVILITILWLFPPTNRLLINFYESNQVIKTSIDVIGKILQEIWKSIKNIF